MFDSPWFVPVCWACILAPAWAPIVQLIWERFFAGD